MNGKDGFWGWLLADWNLFRPGTWFKILILLTIVGWFKVGASALDGETCGPGWNVFSPQSNIRNAGCLVRSFFRNIPEGWDEDPGSGNGNRTNQNGTSERPPANVVVPPRTPQSPAPNP